MIAGVAGAAGTAGTAGAAGAAGTAGTAGGGRRAIVRLSIVHTLTCVLHKKLTQLFNTS